MVTDGSCLAGTLENLGHGYGTDPMPEAILAKIKTDALDLLELVLKAYTRDVASDEVGSGGSAKASSDKPAGVQCPTGLLYGRVQSGKTVAMIAFCAAALDNGFRVVVVLTSDYLKLVQQTARRFGALAGPLVKDSTVIENWHPDVDHIKKQIRDHGLVLVCQKNQAHLGTLVEFLQMVNAGEYPALILDDEADQATLDTTTAARAAQRPNAPQIASTIHRRTVRNTAPWEEAESIRERLPHHVFLQVTATPYALLLQNSDTPLRPSFAKLLEPGPGYTGGEAFFDQSHVDDGGRPPLVFVEEDESGAIQRGVKEAPVGLKQAISFFLVSSSAQVILASSRVQGHNFLCHTSHKTSEHDEVADLIRAFLGRVGDDIQQDEVPGETRMRLGWAYEELQRTLSNPPPFANIRDVVRRRLPRREILIVNSSNSPAEFGPQLNFIVGGNILGRGLTIENLLVTYYLRRAKISQMDTVLQHARMYGYRESLMPFTRVFLPESLAFRFHGIHVAEQRLRLSLSTAESRSRIPVQTVLGLRATRPNVLDTGSLFAYGPGEQVYPIAPGLDASAFAQNPKIEAALQAAYGGALRPSQFVDAPLETLVQLMSLVPYSEDDAGNWDPRTLGKILLAIGGQYKGRGALFYRQMERRKPRLTTGAAFSGEIDLAHSQQRPVLLLFRDTGKYLGRQFWYPTVVLPTDMPTQVFNIT
jgi:hypothetical protein